MNDSGFSGGHLLAAFLVGAATGAVVALLTTPTSGAENRERLKAAYETAKARLQRAEKQLEEGKKA
jgi:gas vesicle protein